MTFLVFVVVWTYIGCCFLLANKDIGPIPLPPPRKDSFHFSPTSTNLPEYGSVIALANDLIPETLTFMKNDKAVLKESYTVSSMSSYSYSEKSVNPVQEVNQSSASANTHKRKVSSLKITPVTIPDPPAHQNSHADVRSQTQTTGSPPPTSPPPQSGPVPSPPATQTASLSVHLGTENQKNPTSLTSNPGVELKVPDGALKQTPTSAPSQGEMRKPPAIPPRPSPVELLVHKWPHVTTEQNTIVML